MTMNQDLTNFGLLKITGSDAAKFLQGQLTCDLEKITPGQFSLAAHCNPKGRVITLFYLCNYLANYYLFMQRNMVSVSMNALKKYAVFFKVTLADASDELVADENIVSLTQRCYQEII